MKIYKYFIALFISVIVSCVQQEEKKPIVAAEVKSDVVTLTAEQTKNANITTGYFTEEVMATSIEASGRLEAPPQNVVTISAPFGGFVKSIDLLQGMPIRKGQVVAVLQHPDYILFQQNYLELKVELEFLEAEYARQLELAKDNINAQKTVQSAKSKYMMTKAKFDGLHERLKLMNLEIEPIEMGQFTSMIKLFAPFSGYITEINVNLGEFVNPNVAIAKIVDTNHLHVELKIFEKDIFKIRKGQTILFTLNGDQKVRNASVYLIGKEISSDRTITIHGHLEQKDDQLLPGMYLAAEIESDSQTVTVLPEEAVVRFEANSFVFTVESNGQFKMVKVITGIVKEGKIAVSFPEYINGKTKLVLTGAYSLLSMLKNGEPEF